MVLAVNCKQPGRQTGLTYRAGVVSRRQGFGYGAANPFLVSRGDDELGLPFESTLRGHQDFQPGSRGKKARS